MSTVTQLGFNIFATDRASGTFNKTGKSVDQLRNRVRNASMGMVQAGGVLTATVTAGIVGLGAAALSTANKYDEAAKTIRKGTGATGKDLDGLVDSFKDVNLRVPQSIEDVSTAIADLNTRTGRTGKGLEDLAEQTLNLGRIAGEDTAGLIQKTTRVFGDWDVATKDQAGTLDLLWRAAQSTGIEVGTLSEQLVSFGAPLRQVGFSLEESAAMLGAFEKEGVNVGKVTSGLSQAIGRLAKAGEDPTEAFARLVEEIKNTEDSGKATEKAIELFGMRAGPDLAEAISQGRFEVGDLTDAIANGEETIANAAADTLTLSDRYELLKKRAMDAVEPIGQSLLGALEKLMPHLEDAADFVRDLGEKFQNLGPRTKTAIFILAGLAAVLGPLLVIVGTLGLVLTGLGTVFAILTSPITLVVAAIALVIAGIVILWNKSERFRDFIIRSWDRIKKAAIETWQEKIAPAIDKVREQLVKMWPKIQEIIKQLRQIFLDAWAEIGPILVEWKEKIVAWYTDNKETIDAALKFIGGAMVTTFLLSIGAIIGILVILGITAIKTVEFTIKVLDFLMRGVGRISGAIRGTLAILGENIKEIWSGAVNFLVDTWDTLNPFPAIKKAIDVLVGGFKTGVDGIKDKWAELKSGIRKPVDFMINTVWNPGVVKMWNSIADLIGLKDLSKISFSAATGMVLPGYSAARKDSMLVNARPGEGILVPEVVRALGSGTINALNALGNKGPTTVANALSGGSGSPKLSKFGGGFEDQSKWERGAFAGMFPGFAKGGVVGLLKSFAGKVKDFFPGGVEKAVSAVLDPLVGSVGDSFGRDGIAGAAAYHPAKTIAGKIKSMAKDWEDLLGGGDAGAVIAKAQSYVGMSGRPNKFSKAMGMPMGPWCGGFISKVFQEAGATGAINGITPTNGGAAVLTYLNKMKKADKNKPRVGDLMTYRGSGHINLFAGGNRTIGGNESNAVREQQGYWKSATAALRPDYGLGGGGGGVGKGASAWAGTVSRALKMLGLSRSHMSNVLSAIQKESGGNPRAINLWDSNAKRGIPSKGLLQVIDPTFTAYAGPLRSRGVYNPLANIYAAINYARARYGSGWSARMARPGGYENGTDHVPSNGMYYLHEGEQVVPAPNSGYSGGGELHLNFNGPVSSKQDAKRMVLEAWRELERDGLVSKVIK